MFSDAFIWGLGVSCGGAIGLIGFVLTLWAMQWASGKSAQTAAMHNFNELTLAALRNRNNLIEDTNEAPCRMADVMEERKDDLRRNESNHLNQGET